jgi:tetratricopeptide (TPR) repeat protein
MYRSFNDISKGLAGYPLSTEVSMRFTFVLFLAIVGSSLLTILLEKSGVENGVTMMEEAVMDSELDSMLVRIDQLSKTASSLFLQAKNDVEMQAKYAVDNMNATYGNTRYASGTNSYVNYPLVSDSTSNMVYPPGAIQGDFNSQVGAYGYDSYFYSGWWRKGSYTYSSRALSAANTEYLMSSRVLENSWVPLLASNPNYGEVYMGFENSLMRKLPWYDLSSYQVLSEAACTADTSVSQGYPCMYYECQTNKAYQHGYEPVCRTWYIMAKANQTGAIFSPPYLGASKGLAMITVAKAVRVNETSSFIGAIGIDIYIDTLSDSVLAATVLETGYTYLIDSDLNVIMHPDASSSSVQTICELEFDSCSSANAQAYDTHIAAAIDVGDIGQWRFLKDDSTAWWVTYAPVNGTSYFMLMTVPEAEVDEIAEAIRTTGNTAINTVIGLAVALGLIMLFLGQRLSQRISQKIAGPVEEFNGILAGINNHQMEAINVDLSVNEFAQISKLQSRILSLYLAVRFSTNSYYNQDFNQALQYLEEVENMFKDMHQKAAIGVVLNNKGEILRGDANKNKTHRDKEVSRDAYSGAARVIQQAIGNAESQLVLNEKKIEAVDERRKKKGIEPGSIQDRPYSDVERPLRRRALKLLSTLASRQNNLCVCLKDAGRPEDALEAAAQAYTNYERADDLLGMIRVAGNKGLIWTEMNSLAQADACFQEAYRMAHSKFSHEPSEESCNAFQYACMNVGVYKLALVEQHKDDNAKQSALEFFYYAITVSNRVQKDVLNTCVRNIHKIFSVFYDGEKSDLAAVRIAAMFPNIIKSKSKVAFLVDVSPSMNGHDRIQKAVNVLTNIVDTKMVTGDYIHLDIFARAHDKIIAPMTLNSENKPVVLDAIYALQYRCTSGATFFFKSLLELGKDMCVPYNLNKEKTKSANLTVLALTDGEDNEYKTSPQQVKQFYSDYGITLIVVTIAVSPRTTEYLQSSLMEKPELLLCAQDDPSSLFEAMTAGFEMASGNVTMESL